MTGPSIQGETEKIAPIVGAEVAVLSEFHAEPGEYIHGQFERVFLYSDEVVKMSQVRGEKNSVTEELKDSIEHSVLINSIDVARLDESTMIEYINFVNEVWGSKTTIEEFADKKRPDGTYYLVVAGHSRLQAITELELEQRISRNRLEVKVHNISTPDDIIQLQLDENIHSQPPRERRAVAIVETFEWGVRTGKWKTQKEFLEQKSKVGKSVLSDALAFSNVPPEIRNFVFGGKAAYDTGIELGKSADDIKEYLLFRMKKKESELDEEESEKLKEAIKIRLTIEMNNILKGRLNTSAARKRIHAVRSVLRREINQAEADESAPDEVSLFEFDLKTSKEILDEDLAEYRAQIQAFLREYTKQPTTAAGELIQLHRAVIDPKLFNEIVGDFEANAAKARLMVGSTAMVTLDISV